ncbi:MAG TPA: hypothetical protein VF317_11100 [Dermatophilaceae bacterium]
MSTGPRSEDPILRVVCDAGSHKEVVVATFRSFPLTEEQDQQLRQGISPVRYWYWSREIAVGGGPIDPQTRQRAWKHTRKISEAERSELRGPEVERSPKRLVRDPVASADVLECPLCGLRLVINRGRFEERMDACLDAGVSRLGLPALVAILT